jgi:hypothetical protein
VYLVAPAHRKEPSPLGSTPSSSYSTSSILATGSVPHRHRSSSGFLGRCLIPWCSQVLVTLPVPAMLSCSPPLRLLV